MSYVGSIYQILKAVEISYDNDDYEFSKTFDLSKLKISEKKLHLLLQELVEEKYIKDFSITISGKSTFTSGIPRLSLKGLLFLEENTTMKKAFRLLKEAKEWIPGA